MTDTVVEQESAEQLPVPVSSSTAMDEQLFAMQPQPAWRASLRARTIAARRASPSANLAWRRVIRLHGRSSR